MPIIQFGQWLPDQAGFGNPGAITATNVVPTASGYGPVKSFISETNALDSRPTGALSLKDLSGNVRQYAGDAAKLYERVSQTWTDRSQSGGYSTPDSGAWEFTRWKNKVLATNFADNPQQIELGGTAFSDLTTDVKGKHIDVVGDFVVVGNTEDTTDGHVQNRVRWSAIGDETDWTVSAATLSDYQDIKTGGAVERIVGGEFGLIIMERSVYRMTFVGAPIAFQFDEILPNIGTISPGSVARDGDRVYFLSERGFFVISGSDARPIGDARIDKTVLADLDIKNAGRMSATADVGSKRILWAYPGAGNVGGRPNKIVVYDQTLDRWSLIEQDVELLYRASGVGVDLESLDAMSSSIDTLDVSLDDPSLQGDVAILGAFNSSFQAGSFSGPNMIATLDTKEVELTPGRNTRVNGFTAIVDGGTITAKVGSRDRTNAVPIFGPELSQMSSGRFAARSNARYHRFRVQIEGEWDHAIGVQVVPRESRIGGRRG